MAVRRAAGLQRPIEGSRYAVAMRTLAFEACATVAFKGSRDAMTIAWALACHNTALWANFGQPALATAVNMSTTFSFSLKSRADVDCMRAYSHDTVCSKPHLAESLLCSTGSAKRRSSSSPGSRRKRRGRRTQWHRPPAGRTWLMLGRQRERGRGCGLACFLGA